MSVDRKVLDRLSGFRGLDDVSPPPGFWSECGGGIAYDGALRLFPFSSNRDLASFGEWNSTNGWRSGYRDLAAGWSCFGEDAFGSQYLVSAGATPKVALFFAETGEMEELGVDPAEFLQMIVDDPENTIWLSLYQACVEQYGDLSLRRHFALCVESALGGKMSVENVRPMDSLEHMRALAEIAEQIRDVPIGTKFTSVKLSS